MEYWSVYDTVMSNFVDDVAEHKMEVVLEKTPEQPVRMLKFSKPGTLIHSFQIVTFPEHLIFTGDMGDFVFQIYDDDLLCHARKKDPNKVPSLGYWFAKTYAFDLRTSPTGREFSPSLAKDWVKEQVQEWREEIEDEAESNVYTMTMGGVGLDKYQELLGEAADAGEEEFRAMLDSIDYPFMGKDGDEHRLRVEDSWELDWDEPSYHWVWAVVAIHWAVRQYDAWVKEQGPC